MSVHFKIREIILEPHDQHFSTQDIGVRTAAPIGQKQGIKGRVVCDISSKGAMTFELTTHISVSNVTDARDAIHSALTQLKGFADELVKITDQALSSYS